MTVRDLTLTLLGTGTSAGIPVIGCDCAVCTSEDPRDRRLRCSASLDFTDSSGTRRRILIDTSPDLRQQALTHGIRRVDAILFTHNHVDHTWGLDEVRRFNAVMNAPIDVYANDHTMDSLERVYTHIFRRDKNINDSFVATLIAHRIHRDGPFTLFGLRVTPIPLLHGRLPILGFRFDAVDGDGAILPEQPAPLPLAYLTDVSAFPPESWARVNGIDTLVLDMLRYRAHATHMTVDKAVSAAEQIGARQTRFIHMTHDIQHADLDGKLPDGMGLGHDGMVLG